MSKTARAYLDGANNYRIIARRALHAGDLGKFHESMSNARQCVWYAREAICH